MLHSVVHRIQCILIVALMGEILIILDIYQRRKRVLWKKLESNHENCITACHMRTT